MNYEWKWKLTQTNNAQKIIVKIIDNGVVSCSVATAKHESFYYSPNGMRNQVYNLANGCTPAWSTRHSNANCVARATARQQFVFDIDNKTFNASHHRMSNKSRMRKLNVMNSNDLILTEFTPLTLLGTE